MKRKTSEQKKVRVRYVGDARYIIPAGKTPSGKRLSFGRGGVLDVSTKDAKYLLSIKQATGQRDGLSQNLFIKEL